MENHYDEDEMMSRAVEESIQCYQHYVKEKVQSSRQQQQQRQIQLQQQTEDHQYAQALDQSLQHYEDTQATQLNNQLYNDINNQIMQRTNEQNLGCWDCANCTYVNQPYSPSCEMCSSKAPPHVLVYETKYYSAIPFGVEIEIIIPNGKNDGFTLQSIAENLTKLGGCPVQYLRYTHETTNFWKIVTDSSIRENNRDCDLCFELVSPVLLGEDGFSSLRNILSSVRSIGIATNSSCGFHVHVDANIHTNISTDVTSSSTDSHQDARHQDARHQDARHQCNSIGSLQGLKRIAQHFVSVENAFDLIVARMGGTTVGGNDGGDRRANNNKYCQSNRILFGERSNRQRWDILESMQSKEMLVHKMNPDRYRKLNFTNIVNDNRPSTIEFRQHGGVEDIQMAEAWVRLVLSFCYHASNRDSSTCVLPEYALPTDELHLLFDIVCCQGLQQFFIMDRRLYHNQFLSNEWKCIVCHRIFKTSRSLSQHVSACRHY